MCPFCSLGLLSTEGQMMVFLLRMGRQVGAALGKHALETRARLEEVKVVFIYVYLTQYIVGVQGYVHLPAH